MRPGVDRLFVDANVLFSAAYKPNSHLLGLWHLLEAEIVASELAFEEARRNLAACRPDRLALLDELCQRVAVAPEAEGLPPALDDVELPDKDRPILAAAIAAGCTHLLTGDRRHFGRLYGRRVAGVLILTPREYFGQSSAARGRRQKR